MPILSIHNAYKTFNQLLVLNNINLTVDANCILGLAGPSGSGKSTLLRIIQQLETLDAGAIQLKEISGFMFQDFQLFPHMNVYDNLTYAPARFEKKKTYEARAYNLLQALRLQDKLHAFPAQLSGGQKQRVALARSLMMKPKLLLCDEPTSGLDVASQDEVFTLLQTVRKMGVSMIIASHDLDFLTRLVDRIILLKKGHIIADLSPKTLTNPIDHLKQYYED